MSDNIKQLIPSCMVRVEEGKYLCTKHGFLILSNTPPANCSLCTRKDLPMPPVLTMAKNLAVETAKHVANGMKRVDEEEYQRRISICNDCPGGFCTEGRCSKCGCYMSTKAWWESADCPEKYWTTPSGV